MDPDEASLVSLHLYSEEGINQVDESDKISNSRSCQNLTGFMLDVKRIIDIEMKEIYTLLQQQPPPLPTPTHPLKPASRKSLKRWQEHQHLTDSDPNHNPRDAPDSVSGSSAP